MAVRTKVLWAEKTYLPHGFNIKEISHAYYHLFYIIDGTMIINLDREPHKVASKTCILIPPQMIHEIPETHHTQMTFLEVKFAILDSYLIDNIKISSPIMPGNEFIETALTYIINNWMIRDEQANINMDCFLSAFLTSLLHDTLNPKIQDSQYIETSGYCNLTKQIIMYIEENYKSPFSLSAISKFMGYNANYLCSAFKKDTGITIIDYLNFARIHRAMEFLSYSNIDIASAGYRTGFNNPSHFSRTFKKLVGVSPDYYKRGFPAHSEGNDVLNFSSPTIFDNKILPLDKAMLHLQQLGAQAKDHCINRDLHVKIKNEP